MGRLSRAALVALAITACGAATAHASFLHFKSPSGNINCILSSGGGTPAFAGCLVRTASWPHRPPKPASCDLDWSATELALLRGKVSVGACRGDIGPLCSIGSDRCTTLAYGRSLTAGGIRCTSAANGVTCRTLSGRRPGFRIAREGYVIYR